jgi:hypothetical protein
LVFTQIILVFVSLLVSRGESAGDSCDQWPIMLSCNQFIIFRKKTPAFEGLGIYEFFGKLGGQTASLIIGLIQSNDRGAFTFANTLLRNSHGAAVDVSPVSEPVT